jgi:hypothetical protein
MTISGIHASAAVSHAANLMIGKQYIYYQLIRRGLIVDLTNTDNWQAAVRWRSQPAFPFLEHTCSVQSVRWPAPQCGEQRAYLAVMLCG